MGQNARTRSPGLGLARCRVMTSETIREELKKDGYSKEEEYFYHLNRKLMEHSRRDGTPQKSLKVDSRNQSEQGSSIWRRIKNLLLKFDTTWKP